VQAGDAGRTEEIQAVIPDLSLDELILAERLTAQGATFGIDLLRRLPLPYHRGESNNGDRKNDEDEYNRKNRDSHCWRTLLRTTLAGNSIPPTTRSGS
jgi:hypothetical protein